MKLTSIEQFRKTFFPKRYNQQRPLSGAELAKQHVKEIREMIERFKEPAPEEKP